MRHLTLSAVLTASLFSGCIVYDNECPYGDGDHDYGNHDYDNGDDEAPVATWSLTPDSLAPGEVVISSLISDMAQDYEAIVEVTFASEDVRVCTSTARDDELLLTIGATEYAAEGLVDMIIVFEDGETARIEGALKVTFDSTDGPGDGSNDGSGDGSDGSGDGSDGSGDGSDGSGGDGSDGSDGSDGTDGSDDSGICG